ncbi:MAG: hypothetical protein GX303_09080 [Clostridiales bacterium]|nr:hypothetical protein [Clostridiales bacterium]
MEIITAYATKNDCYKAARKCTPKGIVVHSTGANNPYLKRYVDAPAEVGANAYGNHWNNPASVMGRSVCVHSFIGYALNNVVKVANILPYDYCCWGVGSGSKGSYNYDPAYIQFEMCEDDLKNRAYFETVRDTAIDYCVYLCKKFNIPVENIVSHKEAHAKGYGSNHGDPNNWWDKFGYTMNDFRAAVKAKLNAGSSSGNGETTGKTLYRVQTGAFSKKANADALAAKLKAAGFDTYIVTVSGLYKVQVGAYSVKANADAMAAKLKAAGYDNFITTNGSTSAAESKPPETTTINEKDIVRVKQGAKTYAGGGLASFVYTRDHTVKEIKGDRAVITYGGVVVAAVKVSDLNLVRKV